MAFLVVAGITVRVETQGAVQRAPVRVGEFTRSFNGSGRSSIRAEKRQWSFQAYFPTQADESALRAVIVNGGPVACSGNALLGASVTCLVTMSDSQYRKTSTTTFARSAQLELEEV